MSKKKGIAEDIRRMAAAGSKNSAIAAALGCSRANVTQVLAGKDRKRAGK